MKLIKWTGQVQDRLKWKGTVERAKTVRRCSDIEEEEEEGGGGGGGGGGGEEEYFSIHSPVLSPIFLHLLT
jgi:hypothetical protein